LFHEALGAPIVISVFSIVLLTNALVLLAALTLCWEYAVTQNIWATTLPAKGTLIQLALSFLLLCLLLDVFCYILAYEAAHGSKVMIFVTEGIPKFTWDCVPNDFRILSVLVESNVTEPS
jgi:hypothetical protein